MNDWPRLLADLPLATGLIKQDYEDFTVEEIPLYPFTGEGDHTYFLVEKRGLSTLQAISDLAARLGVRRMDIGYAGLKDAKAVTRQWMSVEHTEPERVAALEIPRLRILETTRHGNKLRLGHLRANRFEIRVRQTQTERLPELHAGLERLVALGVPNYFGAQRFGSRGDGWVVGKAIVRGDLGGALDQMLGRPASGDPQPTGRARELYEAGEFEKAADLWPRLYREERRALRALAKGVRKKRVLLGVDRQVRDLLISAYQSHLFNRMLASRLPAGLHRLTLGDLAWVHRNGAVFRVEDVAVEQPRADVLEISPSGPLFGYRMTQPEAAPGEAEAALLAEEQLSPEAFRGERLRIKGGRRPYRFPVSDASIRLEEDARGPYLGLSFTLPRGCYATSLLRELFAAPVDGEEGESSGDVD
ncbi:MAG: tRNA pseudouridine(13) synthase TruD [Planctomycetes bacterium]|nr:tRNA pseudouridine(13) synthase TruD [Planctomycetota bacterium]